MIFFFFQTTGKTRRIDRKSRFPEDKQREEKYWRIFENIGDDLKNEHSGAKKLRYSMAKNCGNNNTELTNTIKDRKG